MAITPEEEKQPSWEAMTGQSAGTPETEEQPTFEEARAAQNIADDTERLADKEVLANLPESLRVAGVDIPVLRGTAAAAVGAGHGMTWAYRGVKQLLGIDEESMANDEKYMRDLYESNTPEATMAKGGQIYGSLFEPAGMLVPIAKAKTIAVGAAKGFGIGAGFGASGYVDKEKGQTRLGNALLGGTLLGSFNGVFTGVVLRAGKKQVAAASKSIDDLEVAWAENMLKGVDPKLLPVRSIKDMPSNFSLINSTAKTGRVFNPPKTTEEAQELLAFHKGSSKRSDLKLGADSVVGIVSTRMGNISEAMMGKLRKHDKAVLTNQHGYFQQVDTFLDMYNSTFKAGAEIKEQMDASLLNGDFYAAKKMMESKGGASLVQSFEKVQSVLDDIGNKSVDLGLIKGKLPNYFPRYILDHKKMVEKLGTQEKAAVNEALKKANIKATNAGRQLSAVDESDVINKVLRGYTPKEGGTGPFTKQRGYKRIPSMLREFYATPEESLHSYIRNMVGDIEKAKFFGKNLKKIKTGTAEIFDIDQSVGALMREELRTNPMSNSELKEMAGLLQTRFGIGERSPSGVVQNTKNLLYISLLGNPLSAATQLGDLGVSVYVNGFRNTLASLVSKKKISVKDWGLTDQLAEEFATTSQTARWLRRSFKYSGFSTIDKLGKDVHINSAHRKFTKQVKTAKGEDAFRQEYRKYLGDDLDKTIKGLKSGEMNDEVQGLLFSKLADVQPISLSEVPEAYLKMPNGRIAYMLKTFMLKQVDIMRKDGYNEIKKGNVGKGLSNMMRYGLIMGAAGTGSKLVKDSMLYGPTDQDIPVPNFDEIPAEFGTNLLKTFGWSEYVTNSIKDGKPYKAAMDAFAPPFDIIDKILQGDKAAMNYVPIYGKLHHYWFEGGAKDAIERKRERKDKERYKEYLGE